MTYQLLILFYVFTAIAEGFYFDMKWRCKNHSIYSHVILVMMRLPVWGMGALLVGWVDVVGMMFIFPFIHDGVYYITRNRLSGLYPRLFFDHSYDDTALLSFNFTQRLILATVGITIIIL